jgi:uncharacterized protein
LKIAYLHGLDSNNLGPKNEWLKKIYEVYDPLIDYREKNIYQKIKSQITEFNPDIIIGSSMGGFFAYEIAKEQNIKALLFNPALHSRSFEPDMHGYIEGNFSPSIHFVLGKNDSIINPFKTIEIIINDGYLVDNYSLLNHEHDTSLKLFQSEITNYIKKKL